MLTGALPGTAEQDAGDETGAVAGPRGSGLQCGAHVRGLHVNFEMSDGCGQQ